jgi:hypothetical protein
MKNMIKKLALIGTMALGTLALAQASDTQTLSINVDTLEELVVVAGKTQSDSLTEVVSRCMCKRLCTGGIPLLKHLL